MAWAETEVEHACVSIELAGKCSNSVKLNTCLGSTQKQVAQVLSETAPQLVKHHKRLLFLLHLQVLRVVVPHGWMLIC